jgi:signal transduction histidine kinase
MTPRGILVRFAASVVIVLALTGTIGLWLLHDAATDEALQDARTETAEVARAVVAPLLARDPTDVALRRRFDRLVVRKALGISVRHVKVWSGDGTVRYSSDPKLIGRRFVFDEEEREVLVDGGTEAEVSDLSEPENQFERREGKLLEVYTRVRGPGGRPMLFETYSPYSLITADEARLRSTFAPAVVAAVGLLALLLLPLTVGLVRRLETSRRDRETLLRKALDASQRERLQIARELHDGPVQRLAGVAFSLAGVERTTDAAANRAGVRLGAEQVRETIRELRGALTELYPPSLQRQGLAAATQDLVVGLRVAGIATEVSVPAEIQLSADAEAAVFRVAQEATRNVLEHANASAVSVTITKDVGRVRLVVADDGEGFDPRVNPREGHFGLRLLADLAVQHAGTLMVESAPGAGTRLRFEVPV